MGLIGDAKAVQAGPSPTYWGVEYTGRVNEYGVQESGTVLMCAHCKRKVHDHAPTCPWLSLPRIVAALEAAQEVAASVDWDTPTATLGATLRAVHRLQAALWDAPAGA